jgi:hypothetical protein
MKTNEQDRELTERVTSELDRGIEAIGTPVLGRLAAMRAEAVARSEGRRGFLRKVPRWIPVSGLATAAVLVVAVSLWMHAGTSRPVVSLTNPDDVEILTSQDRIELYQDLEFYRWLDEGGRSDR